MVSKTLDLGNGLTFASIKAGKAYFDPILKNAELGKHFTGKNFQDIKALYDAYCRKTNWIDKSPGRRVPRQERKRARVYHTLFWRSI
jgi:hypothetical protein